MKNFKDEVFVNKIKEKLWASENFSNATVMIGSGFSRSASRNSKSSKKFPLWQDLKKKLIKELDGRNQKITSKFKSPLKLASEFEASFGRQELDKIIIESIPDGYYEPTDLHQLLLNLPWADVFTTNYDTLLERAARNIHERKYNVIYVPEDIPGKPQPRIVKLHGSLPSIKPFIFTEEDYRKYPYQFAPFVNTVQQSLMENCLCLIGFSGEDPNFKQWVGWVRDNLGSSRIPIYLIGVLDLQSSERELLLKRDIRPIDLGPLFSKDEYPSYDLRNYKALKWFLLSLHQSKPPKKNKWPNYRSNRINLEIDGDLPPIPKYSKSKIIDKKAPKIKNDFSDSELEGLLKYWVQERNEYPGWVIAPNSVRTNIWYDIYDKYWTLIKKIESVSSNVKLILFDELCWRFDLCLFPIWDDFVPILDSFLLDNIPFNEVKDLDLNSSNQIRESSKEQNLEELQKRWTNILITLLKYYREKHNDDKFNSWLERLDKIKYLDKRWIVEHYYLASYDALEKFDAAKLNKLLKEWPDYKELPEWGLRKASILLEIGEINKSEVLVRNSLQKIRSQINNETENYTKYSEEGISVYLLSLIEQQMYFGNRDRLEHFWNRWAELKKFDSDISEIIRKASLNVLAEEIIIKPQVQEIPKFDPGKITKSFSAGNSNLFTVQRYSYNYIRLFYEAGIPFNGGGISVINTKTLSKTNKALAFQEPRWIYSNLIRCGDKKLIDAWFDRVRVSQQKEEDARYLIELLLKAFNQGLESLYKNLDQVSPIKKGIAFKQVQVASQILSLFSFRLTEEQNSRLFDLALDFYSHPLHQRTHFLHRNIQPLFERLLYHIGAINIDDLVKILKLEVIGEGKLEIKLTDSWSDPVQYISQVSYTNKEKANQVIENQVQRLLSLLLSTSKETRRGAFQRLNLLYNNELISDHQLKKFGENLWEYTDEYELPEIDYYYRHYLITLPAPCEIDVKKRFRKFLLNSSFSRIVIKKKNKEGKIVRSIGFGGVEPNRVLINEIVSGTINSLSFRNENKKRSLLKIDNKLLNKFFKEFIDWWNDEKDEIKIEDKKINPFAGENEVRRRFKHAIPLLAHILVPFCESKKQLNEIHDIIKELEESELFLISIYPSMCYKDLLTVSDLSIRIRSTLNSNNIDEVRSAIEAIKNWISITDYHNWKEDIFPLDLITELVNKIMQRKRLGLGESIDVINWIIINKVVLLEQKEGLIQDLIMALEYLLHDTKFPNEEERLLQEQFSSHMESIKQLPSLKQKSSNLAKLLFDYFKINNLQVPAIIIAWKKESLKSNLPELKTIWKK
ncbi:SIR2 family NAD-dependent protein deacylase [Rhodohalobacter sp. 614A]|uniref:SIR2 family NAD-dependent protein deacylase n=1 Tax=Rhodohalobacter sp. 614A TaxID=2908649 RepID=UPI001F410DAE|nr:SIR2 family protein [Rhodohalobacter sp. 614A]